MPNFADFLAVKNRLKYTFSPWLGSRPKMSFFPARPFFLALTFLELVKILCLVHNSYCAANIRPKL